MGQAAAIKVVPLASVTFIPACPGCGCANPGALQICACGAVQPVLRTVDVAAKFGLDLWFGVLAQKIGAALLRLGRMIRP